MIEVSKSTHAMQISSNVKRGFLLVQYSKEREGDCLCAWVSIDSCACDTISDVAVSNKAWDILCGVWFTLLLSWLEYFVISSQACFLYLWNGLLADSKTL